ncbi:MAG: glycosyltransferase [Bacteroidales bacterium]|nr:glycosyltransferase [Bacteroidales bacterium]
MSKISIIVPVYNVEAYLDRCVQSLLNQTYHNLEIILVDDGSPDNSGKICDRYAEKDTRIRVIHKTNGGLSDARNVGIEMAIGDYLGFVDSDDFIHSEMYETLYLNLINSNADISICSYEKVYDGKIVANDLRNEVSVMSNIEAIDHFFTFDSANFNAPWNKLYKTELFAGIKFPKGKTREDEYTIYKLIYKSKRIALSEKVMYYYFQNKGSIMHDKSLMIELDYADAMEDRIVFFADNKQSEFYKRTLIRYCIWLICAAYMFRKERHVEPEFYLNLQERRKKIIDRLLDEFCLPKHSQFVYRLAKKNSFLLGFLGFHKLYRYDILSKLAGIMFDERKSLMS